MTLPAMNKKNLGMLALGILAIIAIWYFFLRKKGAESGYSSNLLIPGDQSNFGVLGGKCWDRFGNKVSCIGRLDNMESNWKMSGDDKCKCKPKNGNCPCNGVVNGDPVTP